MLLLSRRISLATIRSGWLIAALWACAVLTLVLGVVPQKLLSFAKAWLGSGLG